MVVGSISAGGGEWVALPTVALERMIVPGALPFVAVSVVLMLTAAAFVVADGAFLHSFHTVFC